MKKHAQPGFTLIELLVVVSIIGLLSTLAVLALGTARTKARDAKRVSDIQQVRSALELYFTDKNAYPPDGGAAIALGVGSGTCLSDSATGFGATCGGTQTYMLSVPRDSSMSGAVGTVCASGVSQTCEYGYTSTGSSYTIMFYLESGTGGLPQGLRTATPAGTI